jgi:predicted O-methyltransferase YrrM
MSSTNPTEDPSFWARSWVQAAERSPVARRDRYSPTEEVEHWNRRAESYAQRSGSPASRSHRASLLRWLASRGALRAGYRVLDIGAGPGAFALPMAARVREVTALEPASAMAAILEKKRAARGLRNIRLVGKGWQQVDPDREGWAGRFDLVFASMSPGIDGPQALARMNRASRRFCFLSGWSGPLWGMWGLARCELWPRLFGEQAGNYPNDILFPFGLLYASGLRPELRFQWRESRQDLPQTQAEEELRRLFARYASLTPRVRRVIADYVRERTRSGRFRQVYRLCQGFLFWELGAGGSPASADSTRPPARSPAGAASARKPRSRDS